MDILSIVCFLASFRHSSTLVNSFFLNENDGNLFSFSEAAHGPYKPMTLGCCPSKFLSLIFVFEEVMKSGADAFSHLPPAKPRPASAVCFRNSRRLFFIFNNLCVLRR